MKTFSRYTRVLAWSFMGILAWFTLFPPPAYAYLDPGTGSYIFQVLVGALLGGAFVLKGYWSSIRNFFAERAARRTKD